MKLPTLEQALSVIGALSGAGPAITAAKGAVDIIIDLFDGDPESQEFLKDKWQESEQKALASLDRLDDAIKDAKEP